MVLGNIDEKRKPPGQKKKLNMIKTHKKRGHLDTNVLLGIV